MKRTKKTEESKEKISILPLEISTLRLKVKGMSPFLPEPMDENFLDIYDKKRSNQVFKKDDKSEEEKLLNKIYLTESGKPGIPARAFYKSMTRAATYLFSKSQGGMRNIIEGVTVLGDILPLKYKSKSVVRHWGRMSSGSGKKGAPRLILRNQYVDWSTELTVQFNKAHLSAEQVVNVLSYAGFYIGVGGFRKENTGNYGMFSVST